MGEMGPTGSQPVPVKVVTKFQIVRAARGQGVSEYKVVVNIPTKRHHVCLRPRTNSPQAAAGST